jgi:uncharacterized cupredoxin-like copper-binding protein
MKRLSCSLAFLGALSACSGCSASLTGARFDVVALEYSFDPATIPTNAHTVEFALRNQGQVEHDFELIGPSGVEAHIDVVPPGITRATAVDLKPGTYSFICTIADHAQRGMRGTLTVR